MLSQWHIYRLRVRQDGLLSRCGPGILWHLQSVIIGIDDFPAILDDEWVTSWLVRQSSHDTRS